MDFRERGREGGRQREGEREKHGFEGQTSIG